MGYFEAKVDDFRCSRDPFVALMKESFDMQHICTLYGERSVDLLHRGRRLCHGRLSVAVVVGS